jgi:hypothetical protein
LINNEFKSDKKYHKWIKDNKDKLLPKEFNKSYYYDLQVKPMKYLPFLIHMNVALEKIEKGLFQCMPLRNDIIPKYIQIDTTSIIDLFIEKNKKQYLDNVESKKVELWNKFFHMDNKIFKKHQIYVFNYRITTDGIGVSLSFVREDLYGKRLVRTKKVRNYIEFPHIDEYTDEQLKDIKENYNMTYLDPGKKQLIYMIDDNENKFRYTNAQRIHQTERLKNQKIVERYKKRNNMIETETTLSDFNSKTCNYTKFKKFIKAKTEVNNKLFEQYENKMFRILKLRGFINTQRSESKLINNIKKKYETKDKKVVIAIGNWCVTKQMRNFISTPCIGLKRLLKKHFKLITIDEFRTSILDYEFEEKLKNKKVINSEGETIKLHSVLMRQQKNKVIGCINRDLNGVRNMKKIVKQYMKNKTRPYKFRRDVKLN